jgi:hypothetical protein
MRKVGTLIVSANVIGLAPAGALEQRGDGDYLALEADSEMGPCSVYSIGRYRGWTYGSIEDNVVEGRTFVATISRPVCRVQPASCSRS